MPYSSANFCPPWPGHLSPYLQLPTSSLEVRRPYASDEVEVVVVVVVLRPHSHGRSCCHLEYYHQDVDFHTGPRQRVHPQDVGSPPGPHQGAHSGPHQAVGQAAGQAVGRPAGPPAGQVDALRFLPAVVVTAAK